MNKYKIYRKDNYIVVTNDVTLETYYGHIKDVMVDKSNTNRPAYRFFNIKDFRDGTSLVISQILQEDGSEYTTEDFDTFYTQNTGNFNGGGSAPTIPEAPEDGLQYGRQDGEWTEITGGSGSQDLQSVLDNGSGVTNGGAIQFSFNGNESQIDNTGVSFNNSNGTVTLNSGDPDNMGVSYNNSDYSKSNALVFNRLEEGNIIYKFNDNNISGTYTLATTDDIPDIGLYKVWTGTLNQTSTNAPVENVLHNSLSDDIVWTRITTGLYYGTLIGAFPEGKTYLSITPSSPTGSYSIFRNTDNIIVVKTQDNTAGIPVDSDDKLFNNSIKIEVYN